MRPTWQDLGVTETFPRQKAATRNFQLGAPRTFAITADSKFVTFLRSSHGRDAVNSLWVFDREANIERLVADPHQLLSSHNENIPDAEKARRERLREQTAGITAYSTDESGYLIAFALSGQLFVTNLSDNTTTELKVSGPIITPCVDPTGARIAWSTSANVHICDIDGTNERVITSNNADHVTWGLADFIASEELGRYAGFWWSPDGQELLIERVDDSAVDTWWLSDPSTPSTKPRDQRYPAAGTQNADISLFLCDLHGKCEHISWDKTTYEYLVAVRWQKGKDALITLSSRDQKIMDTYSLTAGSLTPVHKLHDPEFLEVIPGQPRWWGDELLTVEDNRDIDTRVLTVDGTPVSPQGLQVMSILGTSDSGIDAIASRTGIDRIVVRISADGNVQELTSAGVAQATGLSDDGAQVFVTTDTKTTKRQYELHVDGHLVHIFDSLAETPLVTPVVHNLVTGAHKVNTAVLFPTDHVMGSKKLPVLMRPYGGPHGAQVLDSALMYLEDQWFADQGYVVIVADNRGTPGRGPAWDHAIYLDFVGPVLEDQVAAIADVAAHYPNDVDSSRVGITGWSFGGYLSALAVMKRPDVFHAAVAGAPVTEWRWYDTAYTERYVGHPDQQPDVYDSHSLINLATELSRPLMLVHGLADDNVVSAHTLQLSNALLAHRKPHSVLPLSGVSHMTPQEVVAENLMLLTVDFFKQHLGD